MGRIAPAITPPLPAKGLAIELVEASGNWSPPKGVTAVMMELNGAGQGGSADNSGYGYGGQSGDVTNRVILDVTEATVFQVVTGAGGIGVTGNQSGNPGGDTTVTVKGTTHTAVGGGKAGNRRGVPGLYNQGDGTPTTPPYSILLGTQSLGFGSSLRRAVGGCSPLGLGGDSNRPSGLGAGGYATTSSTPNRTGGNGYVLFGYYLP